MYISLSSYRSRLEHGCEKALRPSFVLRATLVTNVCLRGSNHGKNHHNWNNYAINKDIKILTDAFSRLDVYAQLQKKQEPNSSVTSCDGAKERQRQY
jgi:hypothetical protein